MLNQQYPLLAVSLLVLASSVQAGKLADWTEMAFKHHANTELAASERALADALELKSSQWLADDPSINLKYQTDSIGSDLGYREWEGGVDLPLWWPGQSGRYQAEANHSISLSEAMLQGRRLYTAGEVRLRVWDVALADAEREQAKYAVENARKLLSDVSRRVDAGELPRSDRLLAEKNALVEEDVLLQSENLLKQKQFRLLAYVGNKFPLKDVAEPEKIRADIQLSDQHPVLIEAKFKVDKARAHRERVRGEKNKGPSIWLGGKSARAISTSSYDESVGIEFSIPIGTTAHAAPALAEAEQMLAEAMVEYKHTLHELEEQLDQARMERDRTDKAYTYAERRNELAQQSLKLSQRAFELGETDLVRLLIVQADANESHQRLLQSRLQRGRAIALLNQAMGVLPQ